MLAAAICLPRLKIDLRYSDVDVASVIEFLQKVK